MICIDAVIKKSISNVISKALVLMEDMPYTQVDNNVHHSFMRSTGCPSTSGSQWECPKLSF